MKTKHKLDAQIKATRKRLEKLQAKRTADIRAAHKFTAADYRILLHPDTDTHSIEEIMGELPGEGDAPSVFEWHQKLVDIQAYHENGGHSQYAPHGDLFSYIVELQERDPETGVWENVDYTGGLHVFGEDPREDLIACARDIAGDAVPENIRVKDIEVVGE